MGPGELKTLLAGGGDGWFLFVGEEEYLKNHYIGVLRQNLCPDASLAPFNLIDMDGAQIDLARLREALCAPPVMAPKKLVIWRHADLEKMPEPQRQALCSLLDLRAECPHSVLVLTADADGFDTAGLPRRPGKLYRQFENHIGIVHFPRSSETQLLAWLKRHFDAQGVGADAQTLRTLLAVSGNSMDVLASEVEKLCALAKARALDSVTPALVEEVGSPHPKDEGNYALSDAVQNGDKAAAYRALAGARSRRADVQITFGSLIRIYADLCAAAGLCAEGGDADDVSAALGCNPYRAKALCRAAKTLGAPRLRAALRALSAADLLQKGAGVPTDPWCALDRFVALYV